MLSWYIFLTSLSSTDPPTITSLSLSVSCLLLFFLCLLYNIRQEKTENLCGGIVLEPYIHITAFLPHLQTKDNHLVLSLLLSLWFYRYTFNIHLTFLFCFQIFSRVYIYIPLYLAIYLSTNLSDSFQQSLPYPMAPLRVQLSTIYLTLLYPLLYISDIPSFSFFYPFGLSFHSSIYLYQLCTLGIVVGRIVILFYFVPMGTLMSS